MRLFLQFGQRTVWVVFLILVIFPTLGTGQRPQDVPDNSAQPPSQSPQNDNSKTHVFTGRIVSSKGHVMFVDQATQTVYPVENEDMARQYADRNIKVRGVLDPATNMMIMIEIWRPSTDT
jgi:hypothetical protein